MEKNNIYFYSQDLNAIFDIYVLFQYYNEFFFYGILQKSTIQWSKKMTLCAGTCEHKGCGSCSIKLSEPLLKYRTPNELKQTILHEMIHAYLFLTNPQACITEGGHGKQFQQIMNNINSITGLRVTIYHSFTDEVQSYRTHVWRCNGLCKDKAPYYGYVKRSMNRKPQPADPWFKDHQRYCGGQFIKISEPQKKQKLTLKNGKTLKKTNNPFDQKNNIFKGKAKTLEDYAKQMQANQVNRGRQKYKKSKVQDENLSNLQNGQTQISNGSDMKLKGASSGQNIDNSSKIPRINVKSKQVKQKSKSKSKGKKQNEQRNSRKITQWFGNKGKTIEEYSRQAEEQQMMSTMHFRR